MRLINCDESPYSIFDNMIHMNLVDKRSPVSDRMYEVGNTTIPDHLKNKYITTHVVFDEMNRVVGIVDDIKEFDEYLILNIYETIYDEWWENKNTNLEKANKILLQKLKMLWINI